MKRASYEIAEFKAPQDGPKGLFAALVSVFGNIDYNGDRVMPGAFAKSLKRWKESGRPIPVIWSHQHQNPVDYVGAVQPDDVKENSKGLVVAGKLDIEDNENARRIYELLRKGYVKEWSFGYEVKDERIAEDLARDLLEVDLIEVGPTLKGANPDTRTLAVASANLDETETSNSTYFTGPPFVSNGSNVTITYGTKAVDGSAWDGNQAMGECSTAAEYGSICAGEHGVGQPDERQHWALPHHYLGKGPNADGVRAALSRVPLTQDLANRGRAQAHLDSHMSTVQGQAAIEPEVKLDPLVLAALSGFEGEIDALIEEKIGRVMSAKTESRLRAAIAALEEALSQIGKDQPEEASSTPAVKSPAEGPTGENERLRLALTDAGLFLAERNRR